MLIGLTGPSGSQKSRAAKWLEKHHGFVRVHAGQPVKDGVREGWGLKKSDVEGRGRDRPNAKLAGASPRSAMEAYGTGLHAVAPEATARRVHTLALKHLMRGCSVVVDGVRAEKEAAAIRALGGSIWRLDNGEAADPAKPMDKKQAQIRPDATIDSRGGKAEVRAAIDRQVIKHFGG